MSEKFKLSFIFPLYIPLKRPKH